MRLKATIEDVAEIFNRSAETIRFWIVYKGFGKYGYKEKRTWYFTYEGLRQFLEEDASNWMTKREWEECLQRLEREFNGR